MLRKIRRLSVLTRASIILSILTVSVISTMLFWVENNSIREAVKRAESAADMADNVRAWMSKYEGGVYVKGGTHVSKPTGKSLEDVQISLDGTASGDVMSFHQKNPFLALGEIFSVVEESASKIKIAMRSDNYMNDANKPSAEDISALSTLRDKNDGNDFISVQDSYIYYARPIKAVESCLKCHGSPDAAPRVIREKFPPLADGTGRGYGYQLGSVVGITTVRVPRDSFTSALASTGWPTWLSIGIALTALGAMLVFVKFDISKPLQAITGVAKQITAAENFDQIPTIELDKDEATSNNEVHLLNDVIGRLKASLSTMSNLMNEEDPKQRK